MLNVNLNSGVVTMARRDGLVRLCNDLVKPTVCHKKKKLKQRRHWWRAWKYVNSPPPPALLTLLSKLFACFVIKIFSLLCWVVRLHPYPKPSRYDGGHWLSSWCRGNQHLLVNMVLRLISHLIQRISFRYSTPAFRTSHLFSFTVARGREILLNLKRIPSVFTLYSRLVSSKSSKIIQ